jgi:hypothetical protein
VKKASVNLNAIASAIYRVREKKVMLDRDLAALYGVSTKHLKRQVRRNRNRFPADFMFELSDEETQDWRRQFGTSNLKDKMGPPPKHLVEGVSPKPGFCDQHGTLSHERAHGSQEVSAKSRGMEKVRWMGAL